ncbi:hypothetical protein ABW20_dc0105073 [Dactylellina cionopaga]|nr:hypothetical protein ABW20_dc0105073 [Dactylellina cionopaga]
MTASTSAHAHPALLIPEIVEQIFLSTEFEVVEVLTTHRAICKTWRAVIDTSPALKYYSTTGLRLGNTGAITDDRSSLLTPRPTPAACLIIKTFWRKIAQFDQRDYSHDVPQDILPEETLDKIYDIFVSTVRCASRIPLVPPTPRPYRQIMQLDRFNYKTRFNDCTDRLSAYHSFGLTFLQKIEAVRAESSTLLVDFLHEFTLSIVLMAHYHQIIRTKEDNEGGHPFVETCYHFTVEMRNAEASLVSDEHGICEGGDRSLIWRSKQRWDVTLDLEASYNVIYLERLRPKSEVLKCGLDPEKYVFYGWDSCSLAGDSWLDP